MRKRIFALGLAFCLTVAMMPVPAFAEGEPEPKSPVCNCEAVCTAEAMKKDCPVCGAEGATLEGCGKYAAEPVLPSCDCTAACTGETRKTDCPVCGAEGAKVEDCGKYVAPKPEPTAAQKVQSLIDALPETVTAENRAEVEAKLTAIDEAKAPLGDEERATLDFAKYNAAVAAINVLDNMAGAEVPKTLETQSLDGATVAVNKPFSYDGKQQNLTAADVTVTLADGTVLTAAAFTLTAEPQTNPGTYDFTVTGCGSYSGTAAGKWTIGKGTRTVSDLNINMNVGSKSLIFDLGGKWGYNNTCVIDAADAASFDASFSASFSGMTLTITTNGALPAGTTNSFKCTLSSDYYEDATVTVTVTQKAKNKVELTDVKMDGWTYDGNPRYLNYVPAYPYYNFTVTYGKRAGDSYQRVDAPVDAGDYKVEVSYEDNSSVHTGSASFYVKQGLSRVDFGIEKTDELGVSILELTYGDHYTLIPTGTYDELEYYTLKGFDVISLDAYGNIIALKAGEAFIGVRNIAKNYNGDSMAFSVVVYKAPVTVTAKNQTAYVGDAVPVLGDDYTLDGLLGADTLNGTISLAYEETPDMTKPGTYKIIPTFQGTDERYDVTAVSGTLTIEPPLKHTVTYKHGNHGTGTETSVTATREENVNLAGAIFTRTGYTQTGWATTDGGKKAYELNGLYEGKLDLTLYPVWTVNTYTLTFDTKGGSKIAPITQAYGTSITLPANPTRDGYVFAGWDEIIDTMPAKDMTVTARWDKKVTRVDLSLSGHVFDKSVEGVKVTTKDDILFASETYGGGWGIIKDPNKLTTTGGKPDAIGGKLFRADTQYYLWVNFSAKEGYTLEDLKATNVYLDGQAAQKLIDIQGAATAVFRLPVIYTITVNTGLNGSVDVDNVVPVFEGGDVTVNITPDKGYVVYRLTVDGTNVKTARTYHFENVQESHTLKVRFLKNGDNAKTGDSFPMGIALGAVTLSTVALAVLFFRKRKQMR